MPICKNFCKSLIQTSIARRDYTSHASNSSNYAETVRHFATLKEGPKSPSENPARPMPERRAFDKRSARKLVEA